MMNIMIHKINNAICTGIPLIRCQSTDPKTTSNCAAFVQETKAWWEAYPRNAPKLFSKAYIRNIGQCYPWDIKELKEVLLPEIELQRAIGQKRMSIEEKLNKLLEDCARLGGKKLEECTRTVEELRTLAHKLAG